MNTTDIENIKKLTLEGKYDLAYSGAKALFDADNTDQKVLEALYFLANNLRSEAIGFASNKANYSTISDFELLLKEVNKLTGQDMYGKFK